MKAFISYSHNDSPYLEVLHKHLAQLKRENLISAWTDKEIMPGGNLNESISSALKNSSIFIALISPDYIASNYCYEREFASALEMHEQERIIIVPIIIEPCDWANTPFNKFKALPRDGKAVSLWDNTNTAFLDVIQNIRRLVSSTAEKSSALNNVTPHASALSRNYRVQKDFDSIEKIEFVEKTFTDVKTYLKRYIDEVSQIENIKSRILIDKENEFNCIIVNRNKIATEAHIKLTIDTGHSSFNRVSQNERQISYTIEKLERGSSSPKNFIISFDEYHLYWTHNDFYTFSREKKELGSKDIADMIWNEALESVGII